MALDEVLLGRLALAVISNALRQENLKRAVRQRLGRDPERRALQRALHIAVEGLERKHPDWVASLFNASLMEHEAAPVLAQLLTRGGRPDPSELARRWALAINLERPDRRSVSVRELESVAADFLSDFATKLRDDPSLHAVADGQALDMLADDISAIRASLGAERATTGTQWDYLRWLIGRNTYLDMRGILQTQRQVQLKLDEIYMSLEATADPTPTHLAHGVETGTPANSTIEESVSITPRTHTERGDLGEAASRQQYVAILGEPGGGKTTLLRYLAFRHATALWDGQAYTAADLGPVRFPILMRISSYVEAGVWRQRSLSDYLVDYMKLHECASTGLQDLIGRQLDTGNCLVLLDGLDEVIDPDDRRSVVKRIEDFAQRHGSVGNRFVVTSRVADTMRKLRSLRYSHISRLRSLGAVIQLVFWFGVLSWAMV